MLFWEFASMGEFWFRTCLPHPYLWKFSYASILWEIYFLRIPLTSELACVASVPERCQRNSGRAKEVFAFGPREKWGESKKVEGAGCSPNANKLLRAAPISFAPISGTLGTQATSEFSMMIFIGLCMNICTGLGTAHEQWNKNIAMSF